MEKTHSDIFQPQTQNTQSSSFNMQNQMELQPPPAYSQSPPQTIVIIQQPEKSYWSILKDLKAWGLLFYYMTFNYAWGLFGFIWVITALSVSIPLLILFPVGFPLLYFSCVSFRAMARLELEILSYFWNVPINKKQFPILVSRDQGIVTHMKNQVLSIENLVCILYFVVIKFIISQIMFVVALLGFISVIFLFITPLFLHAAKYSSKLELFFIQKILK